ncbi:MAG: ABC transporter permease [Oscillospiraceae bacterium]|jgi:lipopolysaccharide transport system permease protein|nr:ABC transporter permease [Oscillospiraceae bacterium]
MAKSKAPEQYPQGRPTVVIEANGRNGQYWKDLWNYRGLAFLMARRDVTVRYKQTIIGFGWAIITPIFNMIIMSLIFGTFAGFRETSEIPYNISVFVGALGWGMFVRGVNTGAGALAGAGLAGKVYFPRLINPISSVLSSLIDTAISYLVLGLMFVGYGYVPPLRMLLSFPLLLPPVILGLGAGFVIGSYSIKWRDLRSIYPFALTLGQYVTPVAYSAENAANVMQKVGEGTLSLYQMFSLVNPMTGYELAYKWSILTDVQFDVRAFLVSVAWTVPVLWWGIVRFRKAERDFVDIV